MGGTYVVAKAGDLTGSGPVITTVEGITIGVYRLGNEFHAYENVCAHEGGPACEGEVAGEVKGDVSPEGRRLGEHISADELSIICPWHGVRYDLRTGRCLAARELQLRKFDAWVDDGGNVRIRL